MYKIFYYALISIIIFIILEFVSINLGNLLGAGPYNIGIVVCAINILTTAIIICTLILVTYINKYINK